MRPRLIGTAAIIASAALVGQALASMPAVAASVARMPSSSSSAVTTPYLWYWSDGSVSTTRTFAHTQYRSGGDLPRIVVQMRTQPGYQPVFLEFRQDDMWNTESIVPTNDIGTAQIRLDPYCEGGGWCDGHYQYRVRVGTSTTRLDIQYVN